MSEQLLKQIAKDVKEIKNRIRNVEEDIEDIGLEVNSEYAEKLKKINKGKFLSKEEFEKIIDE